MTEIEILIKGLKMHILNELIWTMTVLGKITIFATICGGLLWLIVFAVGIRGD